MSAGETLDHVPLWVAYLATVASSVLSFEGGFRLGRYRHGRSAQEDKPPVGEMVGATLGLLAFMLAFTFGLSASLRPEEGIGARRDQRARDHLPACGAAP